MKSVGKNVISEVVEQLHFLMKDCKDKEKKKKNRIDCSQGQGVFTQKGYQSKVTK